MRSPVSCRDPCPRLFFTLNRANAIGRISLAGDVAIHPLPTPNAGPVGITPAPDGALWFVEIIAGQVGRIAVEDGSIQEFPLPDRAARPHAIVAAPGGGCWFSEWHGNRVGHISPSGAITEHPLPAPASEPHGITIGPDGAIWVALEARGVARLLV